jgi:hypothetical protein
LHTKGILTEAQKGRYSLLFLGRFLDFQKLLIRIIKTSNEEKLQITKYKLQTQWHPRNHASMHPCIHAVIQPCIHAAMQSMDIETGKLRALIGEKKCPGISRQYFNFGNRFFK